MSQHIDFRLRVRVEVPEELTAKEVSEALQESIRKLSHVEDVKQLSWRRLHVVSPVANGSDSEEVV